MTESFNNSELAKIFFNGEFKKLENFMLNAKHRDEERIERWKQERVLNKKQNKIQKQRLIAELFMNITNYVKN